MDLRDSLQAVTENPPSMARLEENLPTEWIEEALAAEGIATLRKRRLPAEVVVWLVIGIALYRGRSIAEVAASLDIALPGRRGVTAAPSSIAEARTRLGSDAMRWLFAKTAQRWCGASAREYLWRGLVLYAMDGTTLRLHDTPENRAEFPGHTSAGPNRPSHPLARLVALLTLDSRLIAAARLGGFHVGEQTLAEELWDEVPHDSLVIVDRLFNGAEPLIRLTQTGNRHWLLRAKSTTTWKTLSVLGPGDELVEMKVSDSARKKNPELPRTYTARVIKRRRGKHEYVLLTSLLDPSTYPADEVAELYGARWEIENAYDEVKTELLDREENLRSKRPDGVRQEIWGLLLAYNLVRLEMGAIAKEAKVRPLRISFVMALSLIQNEMIWAANASPGAIPRQLQRLREQVSRFVLPERRAGRAYPRAVRSRGLKYPRKRVIDPSSP